MLALVALGNRAWGSGSAPHIVGAIMMAFGLWLGHDYPLWALLPLLGGVLLWRVWSTRPWTAFIDTAGDWYAAIERGIWVLPLVIAIVFLTHDAADIVLGMYAIVLVPLCYSLAGKLKTKWDKTAIAELAAGAVIALI